LPVHRHVLRLSYDAANASHDDLAGQATADAAALLGEQIPSDAVKGFAHVEWVAAPTGAPVPEGVIAIGEGASGVGLAAVISQARREAARLIGELTESTEGREDD
jgi:oxygen-dependent protoporphyrinogen oxidase